MNNNITVTNIQRFCLQDGPGIRTTVFLKGCPLNCPWCSNPENISFQIEKSVNNQIIFGKKVDVNELYEKIIKDKTYYQNEGGVTFSGGEPLMQIEQLEDLLKKLKDSNISIAMETTCVVPKKYIELALKYVDYFLIDIKILDKENEHKINTNSQKFIENIENLIKNDAIISFRIPIVKGYTYTFKNIKIIRDLLVKWNIKSIEMFPVHNLGESKYSQLGKNKFTIPPLTKDDISSITSYFEIKNIKVNWLFF